jgi:hypothetical protein
MVLIPPVDVGHQSAVWVSIAYAMLNIRSA